MKIAILTFELEGVTSNGGVGTAYRRLAELLASKGHRIEIFLIPYLSKKQLPRAKIAARVRSFKKLGIHLHVAFAETFSPPSFHHLERAIVALHALQKKHFDVIHFPDTGGLAFFLLQARAQGKFPNETRFIYGAHGASDWVDEANGFDRPGTEQMVTLEKYCYAHADFVVSPSRYMLEYLKKWKTQAKRLVIPNCNHLDQLRTFPVKVNTPGPIVFFGRQEERKGIRVFLEAVQKSRKTKEVWILGKEATGNLRVRDLPELIQQTKKKFGTKLRIETKLSSEEAVKLIQSTPTALVCMPSQVENSPYTIVEAIESGWKFITTDRGGTRELLDPRDRKKVFCAPQAKRLAQKIDQSLLAKFAAVRPSMAAQRANASWLQFHDRVRTSK